ncbi:MAG TPA: ABC transporter permease [Acidobacteriota bacterium]|jgi:putative ABC transport system permease protein|nr:ABC transporter permease [Acidobacteriota bacterium]
MRYLFSFYSDSIRIALQSIFAHKLRAFLTLIGIIVGVASVVVVGASISGLNSFILDKVSKLLGVNHFMIARMAHSGRLTEEEWERMSRRNKRLDWDDFRWLALQCPTCKEVGAQADSSVNLKHEGQELFGTRVAGVTANMGEIEDKTIIEGRFLSPFDVEHSAAVCVIGMDLREKFFPGIDPIGKSIKIRETAMRIVGVEQKRGSMLGQSFDNHAYIPLTTFQRLFGRRQSLQLHGKAPSREQFQGTIDEARVAMRIRHKLKGNQEDDFGLVNVEEVNQDIDHFTGSIAMVVTPITLISLLVGGIVVMNIMLVSVTERTFEIGLRKAVGAKRRQILLQFLIESAILCSLGGVLGLLLAAGLSWLVSAATPIPMTITIGYILLSLIVSGGIGLLAGIYPAFKAARLDPIIALTRS